MILYLDKEQVLTTIESATRWGAVAYGLDRREEGRWLERSEVLKLIKDLDDSL
jgi:hypothetical protein